jgi:hypothetical protein
MNGSNQMAIYSESSSSVNGCLFNVIAMRRYMGMDVEAADGEL